MRENIYLEGQSAKVLAEMPAVDCQSKKPGVSGAIQKKAGS
jgi:hypothetical protein